MKAGYSSRIARAAVLLCLALLGGCNGSSSDNSGGSGGGSNTIPAPTVILSAGAGTLQVGQSTSLSWASSNATSCTASGDWSGSRSTSGTERVSPHAGSNSYTLTCTGAGGSAAQTSSITGTSVPPPPAGPTVSLAASAGSAQVGQTVTLTWNSTNATACSASGAWSGAKATSGSEGVTVQLGANSYALTCTGDGGSAGQNVSVTGTQAPPPATLKVLSNRSDLVSGDDALVEVLLPAGVSASSVTVSLNGADVTSQFANANGRFMGLVHGLALGSNTVTAHIAGRPDASMSVFNHPNGGPIISGPQLQPWVCQGGALDILCNQPAQYLYFYKSTDSTKGAFQSYDPAHPPSDVATTTTENGINLPFIVREEIGYQDRDQYKIAVLFQPGQPWSAPQPQAQYNHKLLINHGVACGIDHRTGGAPGVVPGEQGIPVIGGSFPVNPPIPVIPDATETALGKGYAVMSTALNYSGHNCNMVLQAESMMMAKERVIEQYGTLRYTIGEGCSGGSLAVQWVANAYPGIYQGILPTCSFPDAWSTATQFADYHLLIAYLENPSKWGSGVAWLPTQMADVEGHVTIVNSHISDSAQFHVAVPTDACSGVSDAERYNPATNPGGVRCSITDAAINVLGPRPQSVWTANEISIGRGYAGFPVDNVGVQYGLATLQTGTITPAQFLDLNQKIGGLDVDTNFIPGRTPAIEPALANAYRSGLINVTNNLDRTAIIDCRGPDPGAFHDSYRAFAVRARLDREHGSHANQLIWEGPIVIVGDNFCAINSFVAMDRWLTAVEGDASNTPLPQKLIANKPADIVDQCYDGVGQKLTNGLCPGVTIPGSPALSVGVVPVYATPRMMAGDSIATDTNKCQLKSLNRSDNYGPLGFSDAQWAQMQVLYADGVCDFSKPGVSKQNTIAWQTYQNAVGGVIYGGTPLLPAPADSGEGWAGPAFGSIWP